MFMAYKIKLVLATVFLAVLFIPSGMASADSPRCWVDGSEKTCPNEDTYVDNSCYMGDRTDGELKLVTCPVGPPVCYLNGNTAFSCPSGGNFDDNYCYTTTVTNPSASDFQLGPCLSNVPGLGDPIEGDITTSCDAEDGNLNKDNCEIIGYLVTGINFLSAVAGMAITASIMIAGYQYMTAGSDIAGSGGPSQTAAAKKRITWALVALLVFIFMYGFLNWLVPGGVL
jgi:hypothetical protein